MWISGPAKAATEHVLVFEGDKPIVREGRPGAMLEAVQRGDQQALAEYTSKGGPPNPALTPSPEAARAVELTQETVLPWWWGLPVDWPEGGEPAYLTAVVRSLAYVYLAEPTTPEPTADIAGVRSVPWLLEPFRSKIQPLLQIAPARRYDHVRAMLDAMESLSQRHGMDFWGVVEDASAHRHPFPYAWLPDVNDPPTVCTYVADPWMGAMAELAWAIEHGVGARGCQYPGCSVLFLLAGRQGRRRRFCARHKRVGPPTLYRRQLRARDPHRFRAMEKRRFLRARLRRGTLSPAEFDQCVKALGYRPSLKRS